MFDEETIDDVGHHDTIDNEGDIVAHKHGRDIVVRIVVEDRE